MVFAGQPGAAYGACLNGGLAARRRSGTGAKQRRDISRVL